MAGVGELLLVPNKDHPLVETLSYVAPIHSTQVFYIRRCDHIVAGWNF